MDHHQQVDLILFDFPKSFETVPHRRLFSKLLSYGMCNQTYSWIASWPTKRKKRVAFDGITSR